MICRCKHKLSIVTNEGRWDPTTGVPKRSAAARQIHNARRAVIAARHHRHQVPRSSKLETSPHGRVWRKEMMIVSMKLASRFSTKDNKLQLSYRADCVQRRRDEYG